MPRNGHLEWKVPYAPGKLEAKGFKNGEQAATETVETTGAPATLRLTPDRTVCLADGEDVILVAVDVLDDQGRVVPTADNEIQFKVTGKGRVAGVGNGDPSSHERDKASKRHAFYGHCMVAIGASDEPGEIELTATSPGPESREDCRSIIRIRIALVHIDDARAQEVCKVGVWFIFRLINSTSWIGRCPKTCT